VVVLVQDEMPLLAVAVVLVVYKLALAWFLMPTPFTQSQ
jgi:hypothetical protein